MPDILTPSVTAHAKAALSRSRIYVLRKLQVLEEGEVVILRGRVDSYYHKQLAQELVRLEIDGAEVINEIDVVYRGDEEENFPRQEWVS